jgi:SAM-dependent methyltransferase
VTHASDQLAERERSWSAYWASGALHSCVGSFGGNYAGEVREFWRSLLASLPDGARLLDVATGNGALPALFIEDVPEAKQLRIDAVDLAAVSPAWLATAPEAARARTHFHPGVRAEALPFDDASFDAAVSQFGLEYTDTARSVAELRRVVRPGGTVALVLHASESLIVRQAREELRHLAWMLDEVPLFATGVRLCEALALAATPEGIRRLEADPAAAALRSEYNALMTQASRRAEASSCPDVVVDAQQAIARALMASRAAGSAAVGQQQVEAMAAQLRESRLRLRELVECALDREAAQALLAPLGAAVQPLVELRFDNRELMAWGLLARLPD